MNLLNDQLQSSEDTTQDKNIRNLQTDYMTANSNISTLQGYFDLNQKLIVTNLTINMPESQIANLTNDPSTINSNVSTLLTRLTANKANITLLLSYFDSNDQSKIANFTLNILQSQISGLVSRLTADEVILGGNTTAIALLNSFFQLADHDKLLTTSLPDTIPTANLPTYIPQANVQDLGTSLSTLFHRASIEFVIGASRNCNIINNRIRRYDCRTYNTNK